MTHGWEAPPHRLEARDLYPPPLPTVFFLSMGCIFAYLHVRKLRERKKRDDHRKKTWAFRDMQRKAVRPTLRVSQRARGDPDPDPAAGLRYGDEPTVCQCVCRVMCDVGQ
jgi:hypothetical protein